MVLLSLRTTHHLARVLGLSLLAFSLFPHQGYCTGPCRVAAPHTERETNGLCGPVREVYESLPTQGGGMPADSGPASVTLFDVFGTVIAVINVPPSMTPGGGAKVEHEFDANQTIVATSLRTRDGQILEEFAYAHADTGRIKVVTRRLHNGAGPGHDTASRTAFTYDAEGRLATVRTEKVDGGLERERRFRYDTPGRLIERLTCDLIGCFDRESFRYDAGRLVEHTLFYPDGNQVKHRETYEVDSPGRLERTHFTESHDASRGLRETVEHYFKPGRTEVIEIGLRGEAVSRMIVRDDLDAHGNWTRSVASPCPRGRVDPDTCRDEGPPSIRTVAYFPDRGQPRPVGPSLADRP